MGRGMNSGWARVRAAAVVVMAAAALSGCVPDPGTGGTTTTTTDPNAAPEFFGAGGRLDYRITSGGVEVESFGNVASHAFTRSGSTYEGLINSGVGYRYWLVLTYSGREITHVYMRDLLATGPGQGRELSTTDIITDIDTDPAGCQGGPSLRVSLGGAYTFNGAPNGQVADRVVWRSCDPRAMAYFG